jgi:two-component system, NtrC family, response regulator AtoC
MRGRVLIADDEPSIRDTLRAILSAEDAEVIAVTSADDAVRALENGPFDLVITDMAMETESAGWRVVSAAQRQQYRPEVVILTGVHMPAAEWKARGVKQLLAKGQGTAPAITRVVREVLDEVCPHILFRASD